MESSMGKIVLQLKNGLRFQIMVNEALTTRLARERLDAIKRFVPIRDSVRNKLQQRQSLQTDFALGSEELFKPVTTATKGVERALLGDVPETGKSVIGELEKIAAKTEQTKQMESKRTVDDLRVRFNEEGLAAIDETDPTEIPALVVKTYENRKKMLKPEHHKFVKNFTHWADIFYKIKTGKSQKKTDSASYIKYINAVDHVYNQYEELKQQQKPPRLQRKRQQPAKKISFSPIKQQLPRDDDDDDDYLQTTDLEKLDEAAGYSGSGLQNSRISFCPDSVINDISRLDVLVGGFRAGNNSPEIINEAADICRRLFAGGIMDIKTYRDFIDELANGYHSD